MASYASTFKSTIMTPDALLYDKEVQSVFLTGDQGEYELLAYHYPVLGILTEGNIILDWKESVPIKFGLVRFFANDCIILVEQEASKRVRKKKKAEEDDIAISSEESDLDRDLAHAESVQQGEKKQ